MKRILFVLFAAFLLLNCKKAAKKEENSVVIGLPNKEFIKKLDFPATILDLSLEKPTDTLQIGYKGDIPNEMVAVSGGWVRIGAEEGFEHERPLFWAKVAPFLMDKSPVTVAQFRAFVKATNYKTQAETFGDAGIIDETTNKTWILKPGANWEYPMGKDFPKAGNDHPVTQVSWNDANAYAQWAGKRLPNEIEWEHAARNARNSRTIYPWGNDISSAKGYNANVWQGKFPEFNENGDGFRQTSPVGHFGKTPLGLTDMSGNVWEWCSNWKFNYEALFRNVSYPEDISTEKAERGGSFLCEPSWCHGYRVSGRSSSTPETSLFHVGFRCVKDVK